MSASTTRAPEPQKPPDSEEYPPLLKHIMSSGSMVSEIEKHQIQPHAANHPGAMDTVLPDLTQPPPTHPAYRGPSPNIPKPIAKDSVPKAPATEGGPFAVKGTQPQMISGNLTSFSSSQKDSKKSRSKSVTSEAELVSKISPRGDADSRRISPHRDADSRSSAMAKEPVSTKTASLLTPGELLQSSGSATGYTALMDKVRQLLFISPDTALFYFFK